jgi:hypothetical protein
MVKDKGEELITQSEAAELRQMSVAAINMLVIRRRIRSKEIYGKRLVYKSDVLSYKPLTRNGWSKKLASTKKAIKRKGSKK